MEEVEHDTYFEDITIESKLSRSTRDDTIKPDTKPTDQSGTTTDSEISPAVDNVPKPPQPAENTKSSTKTYHKYTLVFNVCKTPFNLTDSIKQIL